MKRFSRLVLLLLAAVIACGALPGCGNLGTGIGNPPRIVGDPAPDSRDGPPVTKIIIKQGAHAFGVPYFEVNEQGRVTFRDRDYQKEGDIVLVTVHESEFSLTPEELAALHNLIADIGFSKMEDSYRFHPSMRDGDCCTFIVVRGGEEKKVYCDNAFPRGLWRLREMAFKTLPAAHARKIMETGRKRVPVDVFACWSDCEWRLSVEQLNISEDYTF